jgi:mRNA interferase HigB
MGGLFKQIGFTTDGIQFFESFGKGFMILVPKSGTFTYLCSVRVIAKKTLRSFWIKHKECEQQLKSWYKEAEDALWKEPGDIKSEYPSASFLEDNRVVFNIKGNKYRLVVKINYSYKIVWIRFIGTHSEYDRIDASKI